MPEALFHSQSTIFQNGESYFTLSRLTQLAVISSIVIEIFRLKYVFVDQETLKAIEQGIQPGIITTSSVQ